MEDSELDRQLQAPSTPSSNDSYDSETPELQQTSVDQNSDKPGASIEALDKGESGSLENVEDGIKTENEEKKNGPCLQDALLQLLECPVCRDLAVGRRRPMVCRNGHLTCSACCSRLSGCPSCRDAHRFSRCLPLDALGDWLLMSGAVQPPSPPRQDAAAAASGDLDDLQAFGFAASSPSSLRSSPADSGQASGTQDRLVNSHLGESLLSPGLFSSPVSLALHEMASPDRGLRQALVTEYFAEGDAEQEGSGNVHSLAERSSFEHPVDSAPSWANKLLFFILFGIPLMIAAIFFVFLDN